MFIHYKITFFKTNLFIKRFYTSMKHMLGQVYSSAIVESVLAPHSKDVCILSVNLKKA